MHEEAETPPLPGDGGPKEDLLAGKIENEIKVSRSRRQRRHLIYLSTDAAAVDLARTLFRELGPIRFAHLVQAAVKRANAKPETLVARAAFDAIWRPI